MNDQDRKNLEATLAKLFAHDILLSKLLAVLASLQPNAREFLDVLQASLAGVEIRNAPEQFISTVRDSISFIPERAKAETE